MVWAKGQQLQGGKYQVLKRLGGGGFGQAYLVENIQLKKRFVIKVPNSDLEDDQEHEKFLRRFQYEGQVLAKLDHPNVVKVIDFFAEDGIPCLVMEHVQGKTLTALVKEQGALPESEAIEYFQKLSSVLCTVHQVGLIHADIHPGNIMFRRSHNGNLEPILIDFGSAKSLQPMTLTVTTTYNGFTPYEQRGGKPQPTWDIYALAASFYFAITGSKPQDAYNRKLYGDAFKLPDDIRSVLGLLKRSWKEWH
jgi:serine/threonine-protein kinase